MSDQPQVPLIKSSYVVKKHESVIIGIVGCEESSLDVQNSEVKGNSGSDTIGELVFAIGRDCVEVGGPLSQKRRSQQSPTRRPYSPGPS